MNQEEEFLETFKRKRSKKFAIFAIILFAIILLPVIGIIINKIRLQYQLDQKLDEIRAQDYPTNFKELKVWYENGNKFPGSGEEPLTIPDEENAAVTLKEAFRLMVDNVPLTDDKEAKKKSIEDEYEACYNSQKEGNYLKNEDLIVVGFFNEKQFRLTPLPPEILEANELYLKANEKAILKLNEAIKKPYCKFKSFTKANLYLPFYSQTRQGARLFAMTSKIAIENNRIDESIESIKNGIALSSLLDNQPYLITYLVKVACKGIAINNLPHLLSKKQLNEDQLKKLADMLKNESDGKDLELALLTEIPFVFTKDWNKYVCQSYLNNLCFKEKSIAEYFYPLGEKIIPLTGLTHYTQIIQSDYLEKSAKEAKYDYYESQNRIEKLTKTVSKKLSKFNIPISIHLTLQSRSRILANLRNAKTAIAIERYNLKYKKLPKSLDQLVPEFLDSIPVDPFDGKSLKYAKKVMPLEDQAVEMTQKEKSTNKSQPKKKSNKLIDFGPIFPNSKESEFNKPFPGYKLTEVKLPGYMIYSVGGDEKDNGGTPDREAGRDSDITFTVIRDGLKPE